MTKVYGQIESLKAIRKTLDQNGISRFNSVGDINRFLRNYESEKEDLFFNVERKYDLDLEILNAKERVLKHEYNDVKETVKQRLNNKLDRLKEKCNYLSSKPAKNAVLELAYWYQLQFYLFYKFLFQRAIPLLLRWRTNSLNKQLSSVQEDLREFSRNKQKIISKRSAPKYEELSQTKKVVSALNPLIAGAIGEHLIAKELKKLSGANVLINDFSLKFSNPILWKQRGDLIFSIQIDHLLVTRAGIFIIETKNWSKESILRYDLRSPIRQIRRTQYALFVTLNSNTSTSHMLLKEHHWGQKKLPVRNIVAMINHKPIGEFKFVTIKKLNELNSYIEFFDPVFDDEEVSRIAKYLLSIKS
ncbi:nuclease-related domain-containing protein [Muriicola soli]|uniref:NERD domain-containing protein n=1 Tax=Muriicola soli TaxID=2507538 RepID=A0A411EC61_9FLAO|nr:nuclease-related domain-containing protein [Muriicola soli]QBA65335.1 NERD domain-containing protein [Muriicola soli]